MNVTALEVVRSLKHGLMRVAVAVALIELPARDMRGLITRLALVAAMWMKNTAISLTHSIKPTTTARVSVELLKIHAKVLRFLIKTTVDVTALTGRVAMDI